MLLYILFDSEVPLRCITYKRRSLIDPFPLFPASPPSFRQLGKYGAFWFHLKQYERCLNISKSFDKDSDFSPLLVEESK